MEPNFPCHLCPGSFPSRRALATHTRWHSTTVASASSSEQPVSTNTRSDKRPYSLRAKPRKSTHLEDPKFFGAASVAQDDTESGDELLEFQAKSPPDTREEFDAAYILVQIAQNGKMFDQLSNYEMSGKGKGKEVAIDTSRTKGKEKLKFLDGSDDVSMLRDHYDAISVKENRTRFKCKDCIATFPTYQALGGHRSSHAKTLKSAPDGAPNSMAISFGYKHAEGVSYANIYTCSYCGQKFPSGHAFGGHKRTRSCRDNYRAAMLNVAPPPPPSPPPPPPPPPQHPPSPPPTPERPTGYLLDLNNPPPNDDES